MTPKLALSLVALTALPACGQIGPFGLEPTFPDPSRQICVETALRRHPDPTTLDLAFEQFTYACEHGDAAACSALGVMHEQGLGTAENGRKAVALYDRACRAGNDGGCVNLGKAYIDGVDGRFDSFRAVTLFKLGCERGDMRGCHELAGLYAVGDGLEQNTTRAAQLYAQSCTEGPMLESCYAVARMHDDGIVGPDPIAAIRFYEMACVGGFDDSCDRMDRMYDRGGNTAPAAIVRNPTPPECVAGQPCTDVALK